MFRGFCFLHFIILVIRAQCEQSTPDTTEPILHTYINYINASHDLDRSDRVLMKKWSEEFQLQLVNITSQYRLDMTRHREHNFMIIRANAKWNKCIELHRNEIDDTQKTYFTSEAECLKCASVKENKKKRSVFQMQKEIRKWRKSYKYFTKQCKSDHPEDDAAVGECVVDYIQKDNYHVTFQRLILLKLQAMSDLFSQIISSQKELEDCLKATLADNLNTIRNIMRNLNRCYNRTSFE